MRKKILLLLVLVMTLLLIACGNQTQQPENETTISNEDTAFSATTEEATTSDSQEATVATSATEPSPSYSFVEISDFSGGVAVAKVIENSTSKTQYAVIDTTGTVLFMLEDGLSLEPFENGIAICKTIDEKCFAIDKLGNAVFSSETAHVDGISSSGYGCHMAYSYSESFEATGYTLFLLNKQGEITYTFDRLYPSVPAATYCGNGVFGAISGRWGNGSVSWTFYDASTGTVFDIGDIDHYEKMHQVFDNGYAVIDGRRMMDAIRLISTSGNVTSIDVGTFSISSSVADGGFVYALYDTAIEELWFYDIANNQSVKLGDYGHRIPKDCVSSLKFDSDRLLLPLIGTDNKNYYTIMDKSGSSLFEPTVCKSTIMLGYNRYIIEYENETVVIDGDGKQIFKLPAGWNLSNYNDGVALLSEYPSSDCYYVDINGNRLFDKESLEISESTKIITIQDLEISLENINILDKAIPY